MDFHKYSFKKLAFMLKVTSESENETFLITRICEFTETWVVTQRDINGHIKWHKQGNQNPQNNMTASFSLASTAHVTQWSHYLTQRAEILSPWSNLMARRAKNTSCEWFVCGVCGTEVTFDIKQVGFTVSSLFFPRRLLRMEVILPNFSLLLNTLRQKNNLVK